MHFFKKGIAKCIRFKDMIKSYPFSFFSTKLNIIPINEKIKSNNRYIINMSHPNGIIKLFEPDKFFWTRAVYYPKGSISNFMQNYTDDCLSVSKYYDKIQQTLMTEKYISVPSIMNIIDLDTPSLMNYK